MKDQFSMRHALLFLVSLSASGFSQAETVKYDLTIAREMVNITGKERPAMTINGGIPGPVLEFTEGDLAVLRVHNEMDVASSIHWHGLLVPPDMDGVPFITYPPIEPNSTFVYKFPIRQAGTYWYHSHSGLQEQKGVYGQIVIHPKQPRPDVGKIDHDVPVLFSDWTDESTHEVMKTLRRGSEYYSIKKGSTISLTGAVKYGMLKDYFRRELLRMPPMDISDIYYDKFLVNGKNEIFVNAAPGDVVRLRLVDGSASSFFYGEFAQGPMTIIEADGQPVVPVNHDRLLVGVAETYDVLVTIPPGGGAWEFRTTAHDSSGHASIWIGDRNGERHSAPDVPVPNLYYSMGKPTLSKVFAFTPAGSMGMSDRKIDQGKFDTPGMTMNMDDGMDMGGGMTGMDHSKMEMSDAATPADQPKSGDVQPMPGMDTGQSKMKQENGMGHGTMAMSMGPKMGGPLGRTLFKNGREMVVDGMDPKRPLPPYPKLKALHSTALDPSASVREIRLTLDGDMERYVWLLNNKALHETDQIHIKEGEVVRFIMINRTMMYHPMHLHGHFFRVINGQGDRSPLKHTVTVMPMATTVFEFEANEVGDWFFHCHLLYHMHNGMARVVEYDGFTPAPETASVRDKLFEVDPYFYGAGQFMSHMTRGYFEFAGIRTSTAVDWQVGWGNIEGDSYEVDLTFNYFQNRFLSVFAGAQITNEGNYPGARGIVGYRYPLPFLISTYGWVDSEGEFRFGAAKNYPITDRLSVFGDVEYDTKLQYEWAAGLDYMISKDISIIGNYHSEFGVGAGVTIRF